MKKYFFLSFCFLLFLQIVAEEKKTWTFLIYIAADNDLDLFVDRNIRQMQKIGTNEFINIIAQVNIVEGKKLQKVSKTLLITPDGAQVLKKETLPYNTDSGNPQTLISFCQNVITQFPADHYGLILWNHGTGPLDPIVYKSYPTSDIFSFEYKETQKKHLPVFFQVPKTVHENSSAHKGICFDDSTGNFLTEPKLNFALKTICNQALNGKKFDLIGFDACLMATIEIASSLKDFAHIMVGSQEVELGTGWDYKKVLLPFTKKTLTPEEFGKHIVNVYEKTYSFTDDFTLSCFDLRYVNELEAAITKLTLLFHQSPANLKESLFDALRASRYRHACTHFDEPDLIDLEDFLKNLQESLKYCHYQQEENASFQKNIAQQVFVALTIIKKMIIANKKGSCFERAGGVSIYFPEHTMHHSYTLNTFACATKWISLLKHYLS